MTAPAGPRVRVRPTAAFPMLCLVLLSIYGGAIHYQSNASYLVLALVASVALVSAVHTWRDLEGVQVVAGPPPPAFAGDPLFGSLTVCAGGQPLSAVQVELLQSGAEPITLAALAAHQRVSLPVTLPARRRGTHALAFVRVSTIAPLGLFRASLELPVPLTWMVYPRPLGTADAEPISDSSPRQRFGSGDFLGHRAWSLGDPQRHVDWRAVARGSPLMVKEYDGGLGERRLLRLDDGDALDLEGRLSRLAARVIAAERSGGSYAMELPGRLFDAGSGPAHYHACMRALALVPGAA